MMAMRALGIAHTKDTPVGDSMLRWTVVGVGGSVFMLPLPHAVSASVSPWRRCLCGGAMLYIARQCLTMPCQPISESLLAIVAMQGRVWR